MNEQVSKSKHLRFSASFATIYLCKLILGKFLSLLCLRFLHLENGDKNTCLLSSEWSVWELIAMIDTIALGGKILIVTQIQSIVLRLLWISGIWEKPWTLTKNKHGWTPDFTCRFTQTSVMSQYLSQEDMKQEYRFLAHRDPSIIPVNGSWFLFHTPCFLFVCIRLPDFLSKSN